MTNKRFRFTIRQMLVLTVFVAGTTALLVAFGENFLWASRHAIVPRYSAFTEIDNSIISSDCELARCSFNGLSFDVPKSMISSAKIVRSSPTDGWLAFEDATRKMHIPLAPSDIRTVMASTPPRLRGFTMPDLLERSISAASDDFSFTMNSAELRILDWALESRNLLHLDDQNMDRYSRVSGGDVEAILISVDPVLIDSSSRVRSILAWESRDRQAFGSIWFGDSRNIEAGWIDVVSRSLTFTSEDQMPTTEFLRISDAEMLSQLRVSDSQVN